MRERQESEKKRILEEIFGTGGSKSAGWDTTAALDEIFGARTTSSDNEPRDSAARYKDFETENTLPQIAMPRSGARIATAGKRSFPEEKSETEETERAWRGAGDVEAEKRRFTGQGDGIYRVREFLTPEQRRAAREYAARGGNIADWTRNLPEYHDLLNTGMSPEQADRYMTMQLMFPDRDIIGNAGGEESGMVLPSGQILRAEKDRKDTNHDIDTFFEAVVAPKIDSVQRSVEQRYDEKLKERYAPKDKSWREIIKAAVRNTPPPGAASTSALLVQAGEGRRERGPAKIVEEVLASVDPERTASYIADHLAEDPEFAAAAERVGKLLPGREQQITEADIETLRKRMTPEQHREYDRAVEAEQQRLSAEQQKLQQAASNAWKRQAEKLQHGIVDRLVDEMARRNMPKTELEAFARTAYGASIPDMLAEWAIGSIADDGGLHARIMQQAMEKYNPSIATRIGGEAAGLLLSGPVFSAGGMLGKAGAAGIRKLAERNIVKRLANRGITQGAEGVARRLVATKPTLQMAQGAIASGTTLGTFDAASTAAGMAAVGEAPQAGDILGAAGRGFATGVLLPGIGKVAGRAADAASTRLGKYAAELGGFGAENAAFVGMGTLYEGLRTGEWGTPEQLAEGFGHSVGVLGIMKSIGALKRARAKNHGFYDKVLAETEFTPEETEALTRAGVDGRSYKRAVYDLLNAGNGKTGREVAQQAAEHLGSKYADVMRSQEVPISAKAKLMYLVEGRVPARTPLVTDAVRHQDAEGRIVVDLLDPAGNLVQRRRFDTERKAEAFEHESEGLRKANRIHYYENTIEEMQAGKALRDAAAEYAAERGMPVETVMDEVLRYHAGQPHDDATVKRVVERGRELLREGGDIAEMIADGLSIKYNLGEGDLLAMRNKREAVRTARERAIVDEYAAELRNFVRQEGFAPETGRTEAQGASVVTEQPEVRQAMEVAEREVAAAKNLDDNVVYEATMRDGATVNIIKGANLVYDPQTGEIDAGASDATVVVRYSDGSKKLVSIRDVDSIDEAVSSQDALDMARMAAETASGAVASGEVADHNFEEGVFVRLADGTVGVLDGRNEDGSFRFATLDADGRVVTRDVRGEEVEKAEMPESPEASGEENMELEPQRSSEETVVTEPEIPRQKDGSPDYNAMPSEMLAVELSATIGHDKAVERLRVARNANSSSIKKLQKALSNMADLNKAISAEQRLAAMQAEDARIAGALAQLGAEEVVATDEQGRGIETFTQEIDRLFPDGLPNVRAQVLADIARGQRFVWNDSPDGAKRGVASELGFTGNESERRARFGMLGGEATGAKHVSRYVHDLWQDSNGYAFDMDDAALRDEVIDVLLATPSRTAAMEQLRDMAARMGEDPAAPRDAEDWAAKQSYEEARKSLLGNENNGMYAEGEAKSYETGFNENNDESTVASGNVGGEMVVDPAGEVPGVGDRGDIRVFEEGLDASYNEHSGNSERDRREAEFERLVAAAEEDVPFSVVGDAVSAPLGITPERWDVIIGQLKRAIGADNVVTDPEQVRAAYERIVRRGEEIRHQEVAEANERFNEELQDQLGGTLPEGHIYRLGKPSEKLRAAGIPNLPIELPASQLLRKATSGKHDFDLLEVTDLPQSIADPIAVFAYGDRTKSQNILTMLEHNGEKFLVGLFVRPKVKGQVIEVNSIRNIFPKNVRGIIGWINRGKLTYADKTKLLNFLDQQRTDYANVAFVLPDKQVKQGKTEVYEQDSVSVSSSVPMTDAPQNQELVTATNIVTNFENPKIEPENVHSEGSDTRYFRTPEGEVYGFTTGGKIYLDGTRMNAETPMHEYTELWSQIVARENPELWARGVELMKHTFVWGEVNADPNYKDLSEELRASETLSRIIADEFTGKQAAITDSAALLGKLRSWLRKFWGFLKETFSKWTKRELADLTAKKFAQMPLRDFVEGIDLRKAGGIKSANEEIRFYREFTERRLTTLEKLENKRAALIADRENIANFDERLAAVNAEIEAYGQVDHVAATYGENGADAESDAHLRAVEDAVYDIQRVLNVDNRIRVARNQNEFISACETFGLSRSEVVDETGKVAIGLNIGDEIFIRSDAMSKNRDVLETLLHERTHFLTDTLIPDTELYEAGIQIGAEYINRTLRKRSASYTVNPDDPRSVAAGVGEMISRDIDILTRDGLLTDYLADETATTERMAEYMKTHNVPQALSALVLEQSENIKADLYGKQRTRDSQPIQESSEGAGHSKGSLRQADKGQGRRNRRMGDILDVRIGTDADVSGSGDERGGGSEKSGDSLRIIDDPSFSFEESESDRKLTKQHLLIADLRRAVRETNASARTVAQLVSRRVREQLGRDLVQVMGKREFDAVIRQIEAATVRREVEKPLQRIAEIALDIEIKGRQRLIDKFLALKVEGRGPRGVSVAKGVDDRTRRMIEIVRNNLDRPAEEVAAKLREQEDADFLPDTDAAGILEAYQEAQRYQGETADIEQESAGIREQNTFLRRQRIQANASGDKQEFERLKGRIAANNETLDALDAERLAGKEHLAAALKEAAELLSGSIGAGREELRRWRKEQEERRKTILREAFADVDDGSKIPVLDQRPGIWKKGYRRTMDFLLAPAYSMNYLLKMISVNAPKGEGAMYDRFMRSMDGYTEARGRYYLGYEEFKKILDDKAREVFGKNYLEVVADSNAPASATITITDGKAQEQYAPTIGEALYIYMAGKMTDGAVKLRRMGIVPEKVDMLAELLPPQYIRFADWLQEEFLPERRKNYDATHLALFGTSMAQIEHYVPLRVQKSSVHREVDGAEPDLDTLPSAITGSIIKRVRNRLVLDLHTNALDLMLDHGQQMEHWNAFSRVVLDMNTLLSSTAFRRMLDARNPGLHKRLKVAAQIAADSYRPQTNDVNRVWIALGKLAASSKIAFRINTALKQVLSYPSFYAYFADPKFWALLTKNLVPTTWAKNFRWCFDHIPSFRERWKGRMAGNEKLAQMTAPALDKWLNKMNKYGMVPNALVDAQTCANGAKAVYDFRREYYFERGITESEADRLAKIDAAVAMNETQQSSEGMYLGQIQVDRDFWSVSLSTFQNSNFSYLRKQLEGIDELFRNAERERRNRADYYKKQGFSNAEAFDRALKEVLEAKRGAVMNLLVFTFVLNMLWNLGSNIWKYKFAPESRGEIPEELAKSAFISTIRNTTIGSVSESFANGYDANPSVLLSDLIAFSRRLKRIVETENPKTWDQTAAYLTLQTLTANGLGVDLESFVNMYQGIAGAIRDGADIEDLMLFVNAPKSQAKLIAGKPKEGESLDDYQRRLGYIERRITANIDKKQISKWTRNYTAYRQAELLDLSPERDKTGYVRVLELREVEDSYASVLQEAGIKRNGTKRPDSDAFRELPPELRRELRTKVKEIGALQKQLEDTVVFNEAYAGKLRQLVRLKREVIEMWKK